MTASTRSVQARARPSPAVEKGGGTKIPSLASGRGRGSSLSGRSTHSSGRHTLQNIWAAQIGLDKFKKKKRHKGRLGEMGVNLGRVKREINMNQNILYKILN